MPDAPLAAPPENPFARLAAGPGTIGVAGIFAPCRSKSNAYEASHREATVEATAFQAVV